MDEEKYRRSISMHCSTCGGTEFEYDKNVEDGPIRCVGCDRVFTKNELIRENGERIETEVDEVKQEVLRDAKKEISDTLREAFRGSKHIKFR